MGDRGQGFGRHRVDLDAYERGVRTGPYFVCGIVARDPNAPAHHVVYEDGKTIGALDIPEEGKADLAARIRRRIERPEGQEKVTPGRSTQTWIQRRTSEYR